MMSVSFTLVTLVTTALAAQTLNGANIIYNPNGTATRPIASSLLGLQGFNFTNLTGDVVQHFPSTEAWQLQVNYSIEPLDYAAQRQPSALYAYSLVFPEEQLPSQYHTNWSLCAHVVSFPLPSNITNLATPQNAASGDCTPYLGEACVRDYIDLLTNASSFNSCPRALTLNSVPSCFSHIGRNFPQSLISIPISNWVEPDIQYFTNNNTAANRTTGETISNPEAVVRGLRSGQVFFKVQPSFDAINNATLQQQEASTLLVTAFSQSPGLGWTTAQNGYTTQNFSAVRLVCGRANSTFNGTIPKNAPSSDAIRTAVSIALSMMPLITLLANVA